jgi:hypothetical protein
MKNEEKILCPLCGEECDEKDFVVVPKFISIFNNKAEINTHGVDVVGNLAAMAGKKVCKGCVYKILREPFFGDIDLIYENLGSHKDVDELGVPYSNKYTIDDVRYLFEDLTLEELIEIKNTMDTVAETRKLIKEMLLQQLSV